MIYNIYFLFKIIRNLIKETESKKQAAIEDGIHNYSLSDNDIKTPENAFELTGGIAIYVPDKSDVILTAHRISKLVLSAKSLCMAHSARK